MEQIIRMNEDEETLFLEETAEPLDDSFAELHHREKIIGAPTVPSHCQDAPSPRPPSPVQTQDENPSDAPAAQPPSEQHSDKRPLGPTPPALPPGEQPSAAPAKKPPRHQTTNDSRAPSRSPQSDTLPPRSAKLEGAELAEQASKTYTVLPENSSPEKSPVKNELITESLTPKQLAELFEYLLELTQESTDEGRRELIAAGIPLKFAALHAHLSRRPKPREITRRYDRRSAERRDAELDWNQILRSLEAFRRLADSLPDNAVRESLGDKLDKLRSAMVDKTMNDAD